MFREDREHLTARQPVKRTVRRSARQVSERSAKSLNTESPAHFRRALSDITGTLLVPAVLTVALIVGAVSVMSLPGVSLANPADAVPPTEDGTVGIYSGGGAADRDPDDNKTGLSDDARVRDELGRVSQLSTSTHNPYNKQIRLSIMIGAEFADYDGDNITEGIIETVSPGGLVQLPPISARSGYYFVGWGQGGVPEQPIWDPMTTEVEMSSDTSEGRTTTIFALYADEEGNGYCTCGAYEKGIYVDRLDEIKAVDAEYRETIGYRSAAVWCSFVVEAGLTAVNSPALTVMILLCVAIVIGAFFWARKYGAGDRGDGVGENSNDKENGKDKLSSEAERSIRK